jgi:hypothetical protein
MIKRTAQTGRSWHYLSDVRPQAGSHYSVVSLSRTYVVYQATAFMAAVTAGSSGELTS